MDTKTVVIWLQAIVIVVGVVFWWQGWGAPRGDCPVPEEPRVLVERSDNLLDGQEVYATTTDVALFGFRIINRLETDIFATSTVFDIEASSTLPVGIIRNVRLFQGDSVIARAPVLTPHLVMNFSDVDTLSNSSKEFSLVGDMSTSTLATSTLRILLINVDAGIYETRSPVTVFRVFNFLPLTFLNPEPSAEFIFTRF